jgi:hypothetical protein
MVLDKREAWRDAAEDDLQNAHDALPKTSKRETTVCVSVTQQ